MGGIVLVLFLYFVPVEANDVDDLYNRSGEELTVRITDQKIIMAPKHWLIKLKEKHVKLNEKEISTGETK